MKKDSVTVQYLLQARGQVQAGEWLYMSSVTWDCEVAAGSREAK